MIKTCTKCHIEKLLNAFYKKKSGEKGVASRCKDRTNLYMRNRYNNQSGVKEARLLHERDRRKNDFDYRLKAQKAGLKFYKSIEGRSRTLLNNARKSPAGKNLKFDLTLEHILQGIKLGKCPITGIEFQLDNTYQLNTGRKKNPFSPSIDRIDARKGYTIENTRIVIWQYNMAKGELSDSELYNLCKKIVERKLHD